MQYLSHKPTPTPRWTLTALALIAISLVVLLHEQLPPNFARGPVHLSSLKKSANGPLKHIKDPFKDTGTIPNIVHFVHLVEGDAVFDFPFRQFVAIYSAWHYLHPETIYIHTNVEKHLIEEAVKNTTNPYTQAVSKLPVVKFNHHTAPNETSSGLGIHKLPNQSDFVRTDVLQKYGGVYLDDDAYILRDLKPLRRINFENIVGRQANGQICPAVILSTPGNKMMTTYHKLQDSVFDGSWARHATELLTVLAQEFSTPDHQVLILPQDAFFPSAWYKSDLMMIYQVHDDAGAPAINNKGTHNVTEFMEKFQLWGPETWRKDWRLSYVLHGWTSGIVQNFDKNGQGNLFRGFGGITLEYVLARSSNFARAVYPAVKHAIDNGVLETNTTKAVY